jgi:hypothetical protein
LVKMLFGGNKPRIFAIHLAPLKRNKVRPDRG